MYAVVLVALGGAAGSVARYLVSGLASHHFEDWRFPVGTFLVNVAGCLLAGVLGALVVKHGIFSPHTRVFLFSGIAGGFTTFSAFGHETFELLRREEVLIAGGYVFSSLVFGMLALWLGFSVIAERGG